MFWRCTARDASRTGASGCGALSQARPFRRPGSLSNPALPQARFSLKPGPLSGPALPAHTKVIQTLGRAKFLICFFSRGRDFGLCGGFGARKCAFPAASGRKMPYLRKIFCIFAPQGSCTGLRPVGETGIRCESGTVPAAVSSLLRTARSIVCRTLCHWLRPGRRGRRNKSEDRPCRFLWICSCGSQAEIVPFDRHSFSRFSECRPGDAPRPPRRRATTRAVGGEERTDCA